MLAVAGAVVAFTLRHSGPRIRRHDGARGGAIAEAPSVSVPVEGTHAVVGRGAPSGPIAFTARVVLGHDLVGVRLVGSSATDAALVLPYGWGERASHVPQSASAPVWIGRDSAGFLFVDLARTPDVVTVTGKPDARARLAVSW